MDDLSDAALLGRIGPTRPATGVISTCKQDPATGLWQAHHPETLPRGGPKGTTARDALLKAIEYLNPGAGNTDKGERPPTKETT